MPQQPPTMFTPKSWTNRVSHSVSSRGVSGKTARPLTVSGKPALGRQLIRRRQCLLRAWTWPTMSAGPRAQLMPMTSISENVSSVAMAVAMSLPASMVPFSRIVTWTMSGSRTPNSRIASRAQMTTHFAWRMSKQVSIRMASTPPSIIPRICGL